MVTSNVITNEPPPAGRKPLDAVGKLNAKFPLFDGYKVVVVVEAAGMQSAPPDEVQGWYNIVRSKATPLLLGALKVSVTVKSGPRYRSVEPSACAAVLFVTVSL